MQEHHKITLAAIRHEAMLLEFEVDISSGHLDIYQRASTSSSFYSLLACDDPRTLAEAWTFLQRQRAFLDQLDEARREIANRPPDRWYSQRDTPYRVVGFSLAIAVGGAIALITGASLLALLVFLALFSLVVLIPARRKGAVHGGGH